MFKNKMYLFVFLLGVLLTALKAQAFNKNSLDKCKRYSDRIVELRGMYPDYPIEHFRNIVIEDDIIIELNSNNGMHRLDLSNLTAEDLEDSNLYLYGAEMPSSSFREMRAIALNCDYANMCLTDFSGLVCSHASFTHSQLRNAAFLGAQMGTSDFCYADLSHASFVNCLFIKRSAFKSKAKFDVKFAFASVDAVDFGNSLRSIPKDCGVNILGMAGAATVFGPENESIKLTKEYYRDLQARVTGLDEDDFKAYKAEDFEDASESGSSSKGENLRHPNQSESPIVPVASASEDTMNSDLDNIVFEMSE